jgi:hypothetical protein
MVASLFRLCDGLADVHKCWLSDGRQELRCGLWLMWVSLLGRQRLDRSDPELAVAC